MTNSGQLQRFAWGATGMQPVVANDFAPTQYVRAHEHEQQIAALRADAERSRQLAIRECAEICAVAEDKWAEQKRGYMNEYEQGRVNMAAELAIEIRRLLDAAREAKP